MRGRCLLLWLLVFGAGCVERSSDPGTDPSVEPLADLDAVTTVQAADIEGLQVRLGTGWGQLVITGATSLRVEIDHEELGLEWFGDEGVTYRPGNFTVMRLDDGKRSHEFVWLGSAAGFSGPDEWRDGERKYGAEEHDRLTLSGGRLVLTVYNNVEGYTLSFGKPVREGTWELGAHPDAVAEWPQPEILRGTDQGAVRAAYKRTWTAERESAVPVLAFAQAYTADHNRQTGGARLGVASAAFHLGAPAQTDCEGIWPNGGFGSYFGGGVLERADVAAGGIVQAFFCYEATDAGNTQTDDGLGFVLMPLEPPPAA